MIEAFGNLLEGMSDLAYKGGCKDTIRQVLNIIDDADKKAGDKTYIVLDDGSFCSQAKYIKEKMLELLGE